MKYYLDNRKGDTFRHFVLISLLFLSIIAGSGTALALTQTVTDLTGAEVNVPLDVTRAVTIDPFTSQFISVIGATDNLAGTCVGPSDKTILNEIEPELAALPSAGCKDFLNIEELLNLTPDLVISTPDYTKSNDMISTTDLPLVQVDVEEVNNLLSSYELIGSLFGKESEAEEFITYYKQKMDLIQSDAEKDTSPAKKIYFGQRDPLETVGTGWFEQELSDLSGGINVASDLSNGDNKISIDQIYTWDPDMIILLPYCSTSIDEIMNDPQWQSLRAVQDKQVYRMPKYIMTWELPVPESILGGLWLCSILHPETVSYSMTDEIQDFYQRFYHKDLTEEEAAAILDDQTPIILNKPKN